MSLKRKTNEEIVKLLNEFNGLTSQFFNSHPIINLDFIRMMCLYWAQEAVKYFDNPNDMLEVIDKTFKKWVKSLKNQKERQDENN